MSCDRNWWVQTMHTAEDVLSMYRAKHFYVLVSLVCTASNIAVWTNDINAFIPIKTNSNKFTALYCMYNLWLDEFPWGSFEIGHSVCSSHFSAVCGYRARSSYDSSRLAWAGSLGSLKRFRDRDTQIYFCQGTAVIYEGADLKSVGSCALW